MMIGMENDLGLELLQEEGNEVIAVVGVEAGVEVAVVVEVAGEGLKLTERSKF